MRNFVAAFALVLAVLMSACNRADRNRRFEPSPVPSAAPVVSSTGVSDPELMVLYDPVRSTRWWVNLEADAPVLSFSIRNPNLVPVELRHIGFTIEMQKGFLDGGASLWTGHAKLGQTMLTSTGSDTPVNGLISIRTEYNKSVVVPPQNSLGLELRLDTYQLRRNLKPTEEGKLRVSLMEINSMKWYYGLPAKGNLLSF